MDKWQAIFWDFDGVILDSNSIRDVGFEEVLKEFPPEQVTQLLEFHRENGGLSRYIKFRFFFEQIRNEQVSDEDIRSWANKFSEIMREYLADPRLLINETIIFIKDNYLRTPMFIVSGSDQDELRFLCQQMGITQYFKRIHGSPRPKSDWVKIILEEEKVKASDCILIGDSKNDLEAAVENGLHFMGYNNKALEKKSTSKIIFC